ncbi:MAG: choice-of-anchor D domain-containing protein [Myxococcota bacterium]
MMKKLNYGLLGLVALTWACEDEVIERVPSVVCNNLDYGSVAVTETRDLDMECTSTGSAPLEVDNIIITDPGNNAQASFTLVDPPGAAAALDGLAPNESATITVRFTPCSPATNNPSAIGSCTPGRADGLLTLLDNVDDEVPSEYQLVGVAALPPFPSFRCSGADRMGCGETNPNINFGTCNQLNFGAIGVDGQACDLYVQVTNSSRDGNAVAAFEIFNFAFNILDGTSDVEVPITAEEAGFTILAVDVEDENGNLVPLSAPEPLQAGASNPWRVPATDSSEERFFVVRLSPTSAGTFLGDQVDGNGLIMTTNGADDDSDGTENIGVIGTVQVPEIALTCDGSQVECGTDIRFRDVDINVQSSKSCNLSQVGDGQLNVTQATLTGDDEISIEGLNAPINDLQVVPFFINYTPTDGTPDTATLEIVSNDPGNSPCVVTVLGGDLPALQARPGTLFYQSTGTQRVCQNVTVENSGDADLVITGVEIEVDEQNAESADDFSLTDVSFPLTIEPDGSTTFEVCYANDDNSLFDAADLLISSNDPASPEIVALIAETDPCLAPAIEFELNPISGRDAICARNENQLPGEGPENIISLFNSFGGGTMAQPATVVSCELEVTRGPVLVFDPQVTTLMGDNLETRVESFPVPTGQPVIIQATCTNSCGSQNSGVEQTVVFPNDSPVCN